ncbi:hypothetical protein CLV74_103422 [Donghicola tyrosinivorans]|uniref:Glyoxalase/bleomycin resistance protein/dioxygenase superfamily protein n=1 Tax=Donghicola tyrosinivorans TaxID=1652492 RepID=A0A2T0WYQ4_9RHOB|nr:hypothetical protein CLV74_103422 [Donghicola tyrosinivorans]
MSLVSLNQNITIALSVKDRHASADWYKTMLGFEVLYHADEAGWSELQTNTPGVTLGLGEHTKPAPGNCVPVFGLTDLDTARQKLSRPASNLTGKRTLSKGWSRPPRSTTPTATP